MITWDEPFVKSGETVICFGDSITEARDGYVSMLQEYCAPRGISVINAGRGGDKTPWALTRFQADVLDKKPDALYIMLGANDIAVGCGCWADEPKVSVEAYRSNLIWMGHLAKLGGIDRLCYAAPTGFEGAAAASYGSVVGLYGAAARDAADYHHARLTPLDYVMNCARMKEPSCAGELIYTRDGTHLVEAGNRLVADAILRSWGLITG